MCGSLAVVGSVHYLHILIDLTLTMLTINVENKLDQEIGEAAQQLAGKRQQACLPGACDDEVQDEVCVGSATLRVNLE